jgi:hypothetical protein
METHPTIGFVVPLLLFPPQKHKINKRFVIFEDNNGKRMSCHILKMGQKNLYNEKNFLRLSVNQWLNSSKSLRNILF